MKGKCSIKECDVPSDACNVYKLQLCNDARESAMEEEGVTEPKKHATYGGKVRERPVPDREFIRLPSACAFPRGSRSVVHRRSIRIGGSKTTVM
jgi:hypothetical protein